MEANEKKSTDLSPIKNVEPKEDPITSSLSLSLPLPDHDNDDNDITEEISEHISSVSESFENDRSFQEIEISNAQDLSNVDAADYSTHVSYEKHNALDDGKHNDNSIISLNYIKNIEESTVRDILNNIFVKSDKEDIMSSKENSFNLFADVDLDDKSLSNARHEESDLGEKNLYATNFGVLLNENDLCRRIKDYEELVAIKDSAIAALQSELDSIKEISNTNTISTLSTTEYKQLQEDWHGRVSSN